MSKNTDGAKSVRAVERALDVLLAFDRAHHTLSVTDLQKRLGLSRPTLYRLLTALETRGLVRSFGEPQRFRLDHRVVALADAWLAQNDVARAAEPALKALRDSTNETVALFVPGDGHTKICVQELQSRQALMFTRGIGFTEPTVLGASGKAILAFMEPDEIEAALAAVPDEARRGALRAELAAIRRDGYCVSGGEIIAGAIAIGVPVFGHTGAVAGSVCLFGPEARLSGATRAACLAQARKAASQISAALGFRPAATVHAAAE
jgi:DNA-binding IclR family transcriptional regulator